MNKILTRKDVMTPSERIHALESGRITDRCLCAPGIGEMKPVIAGVDTWDFWYNSEKMAETELKIFDMFGCDKLTIGPNTRGITEALGGRFIYPKDGCPYIETPILTSYQQLDDMKSIDALSHPRMNPFTEEVKILTDRLNGIVPLSSHIGGPFTIASNLRGVESLLRDCRKAPNEVLKLLRIIVDSQKSCIDWAAKYHLSICMADPVASSDLIGPKMYEKFVYPFTKELTDYAYHKTGHKVYLHMCGKSYGIWKYFKDYQLSAISLDNCIDLNEAVKTFGNDCMIAGNIDPVEIIMKGTKETIYSAVKESIAIGKNCKKGFILSTGCDLPASTPVEHIEWFMDAARQYSHV